MRFVHSYPFDGFDFDGPDWWLEEDHPADELSAVRIEPYQAHWLPWDEQHRLAHATGELQWGMLVCDCDRCREICRRSPDTVLVIKGSLERFCVRAGELAEVGVDDLISGGFVRQIYVCEDQSLGALRSRLPVRPVRKRGRPRKKKPTDGEASTGAGGSPGASGRP